MIHLMQSSESKDLIKIASDLFSDKVFKFVVSRNCKSKGKKVKICFNAECD
jgi:hypothetical protein